MYAAGNLAYSGSLIAASDAKFKEEIQNLPAVMGDLMKVTPRRYRLADNDLNKSAGISAGTQIGLVAQEIERVFPELVVEVVQPGQPGQPGTENADGEALSKEQPGTFKGVKYMELIPILIKGIQEQQAEIEVLKSRISELEQGR